MQIKRQRISMYLIMFGWLILFGANSIVLALLPMSNVLPVVLPIALLVSLLVMIVLNKSLVPDDMIKISEKDILISKILSYISVLLMAILILFDLIVKNAELNFIVTIVAASLLVATGIFGAVYFGIITFRKPKNPFQPPQDVVDADFEEKGPNLPS